MVGGDSLIYLIYIRGQVLILFRIGEWLGSRAIRCNWANQKGQPGPGSNTSERQGNIS
jgi:hypothetical protein